MIICNYHKNLGDNIMKAQVTLDLVRNAVEQLKANNQDISVINIRKILNTGSFTTIKKYLDIIINDNNNDNSNYDVTVTIDDIIQEKLQKAISSIYKEVFAEFSKREQALLAENEALRNLSKHDEKIKRELFDKIEILEKENSDLKIAKESELKANKDLLNEQFFNYMQETEKLKAEINELKQKKTRIRKTKKEIC